MRSKSIDTIGFVTLFAACCYSNMYSCSLNMTVVPWVRQTSVRFATTRCLEGCTRSPVATLSIPNACSKSPSSRLTHVTCCPTWPNAHTAQPTSNQTNPCYMPYKTMQILRSGVSHSTTTCTQCNRTSNNRSEYAHYYVHLIFIFIWIIPSSCQTPFCLTLC